VGHNRADGEQEGKKGDFLHSFLNLVTACLNSRGESLNGVYGSRRFLNCKCPG
jgi:hypothetical protein